MAASAVATDDASERTAETIACPAGVLLAVHGIQSWTIGLELVWGRTLQRYLVSFYFSHFYFFTFI
jgi:hypothetical protein